MTSRTCRKLTLVRGLGLKGKNLGASVPLLDRQVRLLGGQLRILDQQD